MKMTKQQIEKQLGILQRKGYLIYDSYTDSATITDAGLEFLVDLVNRQCRKQCGDYDEKNPTPEVMAFIQAFKKRFASNAEALVYFPEWVSD